MPGGFTIIFLYLLNFFSERLTQAGKELIIISPTLSESFIALLRFVSKSPLLLAVGFFIT